MKCPYCKKEIEKYDWSNDIFQLFILNCVYLMFFIGMIFSIIDRYTKIPMSMDDGLNANYYLLPMVVIALFYMVYIPLYKFNKVKGRLLIYTYWLDKNGRI